MSTARSLADTVTPHFSFPEKPRYRPENAAGVLADWETFALKAGGPSWLRDLRKASVDVVRAQGLPTPLLERWKYTNLPAAVKAFGAPVAAPVNVIGPKNMISGLDGVIPDWVVTLLAEKPMGQIENGDDALWHLGNAYLSGAVIIDIPAEESPVLPIEIIFQGREDVFFTPRLIVRLGKGACLTLIERHTGQGRYWNNTLAQVVVGANARLMHYRLQDDDVSAVHTQNMQLRLDRDARYEAFTLTTGATLSRNQVHARLDGENGHCELNGINLLRHSQHGDTTFTIDHQAPHCDSHQFYRTVLDDQAHGVFQGKVHVARAAQKTDGYQLSNALILSEGAEMDTKPELEIYADDVKCSHGATTGQLDEEAMFYLRSRGINHDEARGLLIGAFVGAAIDKITDEAVRTEFLEKVRSWLDK